MGPAFTDCGVIATRVMLLLDDLLWVLTDTQLKAAILYINSLKDMMEKSRQQSKNIAAEKLDVSRYVLFFIRCRPDKPNS